MVSLAPPSSSCAARRRISSTSVTVPPEVDPSQIVEVYVRVTGEGDSSK